VELLFTTLLGVLIGSFVNVLIVRIPKGESVVFPPSHCPKCNTPLKWYHNIPILSWLFLKGKCAFCGEKISFQYPLVEILSGFIFFLIFYVNGFNLYSLITSLVFVLLLALSVIDLYYKAVPDNLNLLASLLAVLSSPSLEENLKSGLLVAGGMSMLRFFVSYYVSKKVEFELKKEIKKAPWLKVYFPPYVMVEAMGEGDIIVGFTLGALLGVKATLVAIFLSALLALPISLYYKIKNNDSQLPFIPFLALGAFISYFFAQPILELLNV